MSFVIFLKCSLLFNSFCVFLFGRKTLRLNNLKTGTAMNAKTSVLVISVETFIYLLFYDLHDCTCNYEATRKA